MENPQVQQGTGTKDPNELRDCFLVRFPPATRRAGRFISQPGWGHGCERAHGGLVAAGLALAMLPFVCWRGPGCGPVSVGRAASTERPCGGDVRGGRGGPTLRGVPRSRTHAWFFAEFGDGFGDAVDVVEDCA